MDHLFVSSDEKAWLGSPWEMDAGRCVNTEEGTEAEAVIAAKFGAGPP